MSLVALVLAAWWALRYFAEWGTHGGSGEGALTVEQLLAQAEAEATTGGRHRLREPLVMRGDLADALAVEETRLLPAVEAGLPLDDPEVMATHRWTLRRALAGLQKL
ncbi:hypothetical protein [Saccharopolyspora antimicrobica]|uniref:hypothetical protein n=1 Tax=Saccharopolyspora antimicrobica TaxID=455193 RepID=UPI000A94DD1F|nr:hypothetical protein [Saccharopolyspora antimicrobica]